MKGYISIVLVELLLVCFPVCQVDAQTRDELKIHAEAFAASHEGDRAEFVEFLLNGKTETGREYKAEVSKLFSRKPELHDELLHLMRALAINRDCPLPTRQFAITRLLRLLESSDDKKAKPIEQALMEIFESPGHELNKEIEKTLADEQHYRAIIKKYANVTFRFPRQPSKEEKSPHPASQTDDERQSSLKARVKLAIECIKEERYKELIESHFDQNYLVDHMFEHKNNASQAAHKTVLILFANKRYRGDIVQNLENLIRNDIQWSLGGRVGVSGKEFDRFMWLYRDGRWNYSPIEFFRSGDPTGDNTADPVDFFANSDLFPKLDFEQLKDAPARQRSLKVTQTKVLELVDSKSFSKLIQFVVCPVELDRSALSQGQTLDSVVAAHPDLPKEVRDRFFKTIKTELVFQLSSKPEWLLDGRIAAYKNTSRTGFRECVFWHFYEGRWRLTLR